ncbi:MAG: ABC-2 transporter permease [Oscillospiraceae bacterium]|nr:ABC-2 transporter permease [Oscillospiraceae bacterium]
MYKNFLLFRIELVVVGVLQLFISATVLLTTLAEINTPQGTLLLYGCMFLILSFIESGLFAPDESPAARSFLISVPTTAKGHIESKFYFILLLNLAVLICCFLTDTIAFAITADENTMTGVMLVLLLSVSLIMEAFSLPFIAYFGANYGAAVKGSALGVLFLLVMLYALFGDISYFLTNDFMTALEKLFEDENVLLMLSLLPYAAFGLFYGSCRLSCILYRKGAEHYD